MSMASAGASTLSIRPRIAVKLPLLAGVRAQQLLEAGGLEGKIVLSRDVAR